MTFQRFRATTCARRASMSPSLLRLRPRSYRHGNFTATVRNATISLMGLRETKKLQTRQMIAESAMGLFVRRGFDHVTVGEIARAAGVSEKTVFNYFPTKED